MNSFRSIIDTLGSGVIAAAIGVPESHVRTMRARDSIPMIYWFDLVEKHPEITFEILRGLRAGRFDESASLSPTPEPAR